MAAGIVPSPGYVNPRTGIELGPCVDACKHTDCAENRRIAAAPCTECQEPIGYERRYFQDGTWTAFTHESCEE